MYENNYKSNFNGGEFYEKVSRVRSLLGSKGLDAAFIKRQDNFAWLTCGGRNYVGMGEVGNCGLLVTHDGLYAVTNNIEAPRMVAEEHLEDLGFDVRFGIWHDNGFQGRTLAELVPSGRIGFDTSDLADSIKALRFDLTHAEIERYVSIGEDASRALEEAGTEISVGDSEYEIAGRIMEKMERAGLELLSCMVAADERISLFRHPLPTSKKVVGKVQIGGNFRRNGLVVCMTRYVYFSKPSDGIVAQLRANQTIDCTYMAACRPGATYVSALEAGKAMYAKLGYADEFDKHHQGGPIGYAGRDYRVDFSTPGVISDHHAFCWNPSITGTKSEDTVICTKDGVVPVTKPVLFPKVDIVVDGTTFVRPDILVR